MGLRVLGAAAISAALAVVALAIPALAARGAGATVRFRASKAGYAETLLLHAAPARGARRILVAVRSDRGGRAGAVIASGSSAVSRRGGWIDVSLDPRRLSSGHHYWLTVTGVSARLAARRAGCAAATAGVQTRLDANASTLSRRLSRSRCTADAYLILSSRAPAAAKAPVTPAGAVLSFVATQPPGVSLPLGGPLDLEPPTVSGRAVVGSELQASNGTWSGEPSTFAYRWQRCDTGGLLCLPIAGAEEAVYTVTPADIGHELRVAVTAGNPLGAGSAVSAPTEAVSPAPPGAPVNTALPVISGIAVQGRTLEVSSGAWSGSPSEFAYRWRRCNATGAACATIPGAITARHKLVAADVENTLRVAVTASNASGSGSSTSAASLVIAPKGGKETGGGEEKAEKEKAEKEKAEEEKEKAEEAEREKAEKEKAEKEKEKAEKEKAEREKAKKEKAEKEKAEKEEKEKEKGGGEETGGEKEKAEKEKAEREKAEEEEEKAEEEKAAKEKAEKEKAAKEKAEKEKAEKEKAKKEKEQKEQKEREEREAEEEAGGSGGKGPYLSPAGKDTNPCSEALPCLTMHHAYEQAAAGQTVLMLSGSYGTQTIEGKEKGSAHVVYAPAPGASVKITGTTYVFASHVTIRGITVQDVVVGNYNETPGRPNPSNVSLLGLTGRNFEIDSASEVAVEGGSWGPSSACGGPYGGGNNSIREQIPGVAPENIAINETTIHDVQSYNLTNCHIEGLAIFAGNHVTVSNSKFYDNSIYDVFIQANSGGSPTNIVLSGNWMADAIDNSGANGHAVGYHNGIALGSEIASNLTVSENHLNGIININDAESISSFSNTVIQDNFGAMTYSGYPCGTALKGVVWTKNVWQNDKCGSSDVNLGGAAMPYVNPSNDSSLDYTLTGTYSKWPEEAAGSGGGAGSSGVLFVSGSGSDGGVCSEVAPCRSLQRAYAVARAGEVVRVAAGSYSDSSLGLVAGKGSGAPVVFEPAGGVVRFSRLLTVQARDLELKGFTFERELFFGESAESVVARGDALHNFEIFSSGSKAPKNISIIGGTAGPVADSSDNENNLIATNGPETTAVPTNILIEGVTFREYTTVGSAHVDCLQVWGVNELVVRGNTFKRCAIFDIFLQSLPNGKAGSPRNVTIENNVLEKTIEGFYSIFLPRHNEGNQEHFENVVIRNNSATQAISADPRATYTNVRVDGNIAPQIVFWNEATERDEAVPAGVQSDYNVLYGAGAKKNGAHDLLAPPGFLSEAGLNLHLAESSAAIGAGDPADYPTTDQEGNPRPDPPDAGALQHG